MIWDQFLSGVLEEIKVIWFENFFDNFLVNLYVNTEKVLIKFPSFGNLICMLPLQILLKWFVTFWMAPRFWICSFIGWITVFPAITGWFPPLQVLLFHFFVNFVFVCENYVKIVCIFDICMWKLCVYLIFDVCGIWVFGRNIYMMLLSKYMWNYMYLL